ncbi:MAG: YqeG family HAD IIIA-type phosphatase [Candidatus Eremiobacteraeota bacterium]|nr:YqeG family HAD IIIA-type phosphatase [Candidatus Eremiobacteraeota bacterium]
MSNWFAPAAYLPHIGDIDLAKLAADGIRGAIVDLDNTLVGYRLLEPEADVVAWVGRAAQYGIAVIVVTNNGTPWAAGVAKALGVPIIARAKKPLRGGFLRALAALDLPASATVVIGDQLFTDVLGAKFAGLHVILVDPIVRHDPWNTLPLRLLQRFLLRGLPHTERDLTTPQ